MSAIFEQKARISALSRSVHFRQPRWPNNKTSRDAVTSLTKGLYERAQLDFRSFAR
jgi:hypothetical protein